MIYDGHIHLGNNATPTPKEFLETLDRAGIFGGCVFSTPPIEQNISREILGGADYESRINELLSWQAEDKERIFPVLWVHPNEENVIEKVRDAARRGVVGFKMICSDYYVYEEKPMRLIKEIASLGKPIFFHSGILWDGNVSSEYNRPVNWEALIRIEGLRFSLAHCSWPWIDECIALYGKFQHAKRAYKGAEMFFDTTPGTPLIYREELLTKLYKIGYDVADNVFFGTDKNASHYSDEGARRGIITDRQLLLKLGVGRDAINKYFSKNLMRFLSGDEADDLPAREKIFSDTKDVIKKWYDILNFPKELDAPFKKALCEITVSDATEISDYDLNSGDGRKNLLSFLYMCEATEKIYKDAGISDDVLYATLADILTYTKLWTEVKGEMYLGELSWLKLHMSGKIFRLGRLQFCMAASKRSIPEKGIDIGDPVLEVHIPEGAPLTREACDESFAMAKEFFKKHFGDFKYKAFTCDSWLLDETLRKYLKEGSNIIAFGERFEKLSSADSYGLLRYLFRWNTTRLNLKGEYPTSSFAKAVKQAVLSGEVFHTTFGIIMTEEN